MLLKLDFSSEIPIYMQIRNQVVMGIADGALSPGERLPTIRALANEAGINAMTVNKAYALLKQEGYIVADRRSGAMVNPGLSTTCVPPEKTVAALRLAVAEAKLAGMSRAALTELCGRIYDEGV